MEWINVKDNLPETNDYFEGGMYYKSKECFVVVGGSVTHGFLVENVMEEKNVKRWRTLFSSNAEVTSWMLMPELPKE